MKKTAILLSLIILTLISCEDNIAINVGEEILSETNFQVEFDGETYYTEIATAYIYNNVTTIIAKKIDAQEFFVITLNETEEGAYTLSPSQSEGLISYKKEADRAYLTDATAVSGRIDLDKIDYNRMKLSGTFSFIGKRLTQQFDALGNPMLDTTGNLIYDVETKTFTNGIFNNLVLSLLEPENINGGATTNNNEFFVNIDETNNATDDGTEYVEQTVTAQKTTEGGNTYIIITAKRIGLEAIVLKIPLGMNTGNENIKDLIVLGDEVVGNYTVNATNYYTAVNQNTDLLNLITHDITAKKMEGKFNFDVMHSVTGEIIHFYDGTFKVTYTE